MGKIDAKMVAALRKQSGAPMMDCKRALEEAQGNAEKATELLRLKGLSAADRKASRDASEGRVFSYVHSDYKIGVLVEISCETDFVARNEEFAQLGHDLCMHVAFTRPPYLTRDEVPAEEVEKERSILLKQVKEQMAGKPSEIQEKTLNGRLTKFFEKICLMDQKFIKDDKVNIETLIKQKMSIIGEKLVLRRFKVFQVGA